MIILIFILVSLVSINLVYAQDSLKEQQALDIELKKTKSLLEQKIEVPENLKVIARIVFGLKSNEEVDMQTLMVMVAIWIGLFALIAAILEFTPFLNKGFSRWLGAVVMTCLVGVSGGIKISAIFLLSLADIFRLGEKYGIIKLVLAFIVIGIFVYGVILVLNKILSKAKLEEAEIRGMKAGVGSRILQEHAKRTLGK